MPSVNSPAPSQPIQDRWGNALNAGFMVIPVLLLRHQKALGLDDGAMVALLNILASWWYEGALPFPAPHTIAERMGVSARTVQRHLVKLEAAGLLRRVPGVEFDEESRTPTRYDPAGLVAKMKQLGLAYRPRAGSPEASTPSSTREAQPA